MSRDCGSAASQLGLSAEVEQLDREAGAMTELVAEEQVVRDSDADPRVKQEFTEFKDLVEYGPAPELTRTFPTVISPEATEAPAGVIPRAQQFADRLREKVGTNKELAEELGLSEPGAAALQTMDQQQFAAWFGQFLAGVKERQSQLGVSEEEIASLDKDYQAASHLLGSEAVREQVPSGLFDKLAQYRDMILNGPSAGLEGSFPAVRAMFATATPGILPRVNRLLDHLRDNPQFAEAMNPAPAESEPAPAEPAARPETEPTGWVWPLLGLLALGFLIWSVSNWVNPRATTGRYGVNPRRPGPHAATAPAVVKKPLVISDFKLTTTPAGKTLVWRTNRPATSQVVLGHTDEFELGPAPKEVSRRDLVTMHQVGVADLTPGTYYVRARSVDAEGQVVLSPPYTFTLKEAPQT